MYTEADEAADGDRQTALENLRYQVEQNETLGIVAMYEWAAMRLGTTIDETEHRYQPAERRKQAKAHFKMYAEQWLGEAIDEIDAATGKDTPP